MNPAGHPNSLHVECPALGQGLAPAQLQGIAVSLRAQLQPIYCSPALPSG